jgi:CheY-like chemotaxis protein
MTGRPRIVIATPDRAECEVLAEWLASEGLEPVRAVNLRAAAEEIQAHTFDLLVADYVFAFRGGLHAVSRGHTRSPHTPSLIVGEPDAVARAVAERHHTTYLERPVDRASIVCMVSMVIMENRPVRRSVRKAVPRLEAIVDGIASRILDVSNEGLRLEIPRSRRSASPPYFNVRIPLVGVSLTIQRVWTSVAADVSRDVGFCGGALADNPQRAGDVWRGFVDALPTDSGPGSRIVQIQ